MSALIGFRVQDIGCSVLRTRHFSFQKNNGRDPVSEALLGRLSYDFSKSFYLMRIDNEALASLRSKKYELGYPDLDSFL